jgi:hypothetical protein
MTAFDWSIIMIGPGGGISYSLMLICLLVEIYLWRKVVCFVLFVCRTEISVYQGVSCRTLGSFSKLSMSTGALTWFETVCSHRVKAIDYWTIFSMKTKQDEKCVFLVLLESPWWVWFYRVYFTIFRAKVWKILIFLVNCIAENSKQIAQIWVWKGKSSWAFNVFTLVNLEIFNSENGENKESVHTWANVKMGLQIHFILKGQLIKLKPNPNLFS